MDFPPGYLSPKSHNLYQEKKKNNYLHGCWICDTMGPLDVHSSWTLSIFFYCSYCKQYHVRFFLSLSTYMKQGNQRPKSSQKQGDYFSWPVCHIKKHLSEHVHNGLPPATTALWPNLPNQKSGNRLILRWYYCRSYDIGRKILLQNQK